MYVSHPFFYKVSPAEEKHLHSIILPPPGFKIEMVCSCLCIVLSFPPYAEFHV